MDDTQRLLVLGQINHIHVTHMTQALAARGFDVVVAGQQRAGFGKIPDPSPGITLVELPSAPGNTLSGVASQVRDIRRLLRRHQPDVVQAHWLCGYAAFAAIAGARPLVSNVWGSDILLANRAQRLANRIALRSSALAIGESSEICAEMVALGARPENVAKLTWGVDTDRFSPTADRAAVRAQLGLPEGRLVLSPRSLLPLYNPTVIIEAFAKVAERFPDVQLVMLSLYDGEHELGDIPFPDRVHIVGNVPYELMPDYLRAADVSISIPSSDGSPRTVWEAMAAGSPVIVSDLPWLQGDLTPGKDAVVTPIDAEAVGSAITELLEHPERAAAMAESARALVVGQRDAATEMDALASRIHAVAESPAVRTRILPRRHPASSG